MLSEFIVTEKNDAAFLQYNVSALNNIRDIHIEDGVRIGIGSLDPTVERGFYVKSSRQVETTTSHRRPIYRRTRIMMAVEEDIEGVSYLRLRCSCGFLCHRFHACRHIYAVIQRMPQMDDFYPQCYKSYELNYALDVNFTLKCDRIMDALERDGTQVAGIVYPGKMNDIKVFDDEVNPLVFFTDTYQRCVDVNPSSKDRNNKFNQGIDRGISGVSVERAYMQKSKSKMTPFNLNFPVFKMIMDRVKTEEQQDYVSKVQHDMLEHVMALGVGKKRKAEPEPILLNVTTKESSAANRTIGIASIPAIDHRQKKTRHAPHGSPSKYKS